MRLIHLRNQLPAAKPLASIMHGRRGLKAVVRAQQGSQKPSDEGMLGQISSALNSSFAKGKIAMYEQMAGPYDQQQVRKLERRFCKRYWSPLLQSFLASFQMCNEL